MPLPFNLQKLPPESLDILRTMGKAAGPLTAEQMEAQSGLAYRLVGKAIRRLVNFDYIKLAGNTYELTTDGGLAVKDLAAYDIESSNDVTMVGRTTLVIARRLTVVMARAFTAGVPNDIYFGVNPPAPETPILPGNIHVVLKVSAVGGTLGTGDIALEIPPQKAAAPIRVALTPAAPGKTVRVRVDAFQAREYDNLNLDPLGGMYFDVHVAAQPAPADSTSRAVGMDLMVKAL
jgi:hypothetical protein